MSPAPEPSAKRARHGNRDPSPIRRSRSRSVSRSPPRKRKRPGAGARISAEDREAARQRQIEREQLQSKAAQQDAAARGVHDYVRQHYNAVPEYGREWRKTDSKIKGLRSFNNWVKSALIQKFSPGEDYTPGSNRRVPGAVYEQERSGLKVLDIGCGKGGDLQKWNAAPQKVDLYVGMDPADVSIKQARERYTQMQNRRPRGRGPQRPLFHAEFFTRDCFGEWMGQEPVPRILKDVGFDMTMDMEGRGAIQRWEESGFDVISMMFCLHYAFESEFKARMMLRNVSASLRKGGRFLGVIPNSDKITERVEQYHQANPSANATTSSKPPNEYDSDDDWDPEKSLDAEEEKKEPVQKTEESKEDGQQDGEDGEIKEEGFEWGNGIYRVRFPGKTPSDGIFRPPFGWRYFYFLEEAVEEVPEYVVPWEAFRALALEFNLELQFRKPFNEVWEDERDDPELDRLSKVMGVRTDDGRLRVNPVEMEAASFYHAFCFYKTGP